MRINKTISIIALSLMLASGGMNIAVAGNHASGVTGSVARSIGTVIYSSDTAADNHASRANWNAVGGTSGGLTNHSGAGSTVSRNTGENISAVQACRAETFPRPMTCSGWNNWY
ncbi:MAG: hypothetical protein Q4P71_09040 [Actinomycetaceae bacterium]|nr:hypothetical protein [Actinomycetaceae bacterium]